MDSRLLTAHATQKATLGDLFRDEENRRTYVYVQRNASDTGTIAAGDFLVTYAASTEPFSVGLNSDGSAGFSSPIGVANGSITAAYFILIQCDGYKVVKTDASGTIAAGDTLHLISGGKVSTNIDRASGTLVRRIVGTAVAADNNSTVACNITIQLP